MTDLLALTADLVAVPSESHHERVLVDRLHASLAAVPWLEVERVGENLVARTNLGRERRLLLAGHTDTVPPNGNSDARIDGDTLWGVGSTDMKAGLAVMLELARTVDEPAVDATYVFYAAEEVAAVHNGLAQVFRERPELLEADAALLGEPTDAAIEAGCQGSMRFDVFLKGERAHVARPWMGRNAVHRLGAVLRILDGYEARRPVLDGCEFREALQAVWVEGGVAGNVVPDRARVTINHRFAPDRSADEAEAHVRSVLAPALEPGDEVELVDVAAAAPPSLDHPLIAALIERTGQPVKAKLGWTDVARFAAHGIPAANFGPGDSTLAHTTDERVDRAPIEACFAALDQLLRTGA
ncbi:MAG TPA: succinyl-diaminopimelate desuccinylase [Acidimicrobiales bacterium]